MNHFNKTIKQTNEKPPNQNKNFLKCNLLSRLANKCLQQVFEKHNSMKHALPKWTLCTQRLGLRRKYKYPSSSLVWFIYPALTPLFHLASLTEGAHRAITSPSTMGRRQASGRGRSRDRRGGRRRSRGTSGMAPG